MLKFVILDDGETFGEFEGAVVLTVEESTLSVDALDDLECGTIDTVVEEIEEGMAKGEIVPLG